MTDSKFYGCPNCGRRQEIWWDIDDINPDEDIICERCGHAMEDITDDYEVLFLKRLVNEGAHRIYGDDIPQEVTDRINMEYDVIVPNKFDSYILIIWDIYNFCNTPERVREFCANQGLTAPADGIIPLGPGRGSVGGSMVCYCLGIHECDPLLFGLYFERFLNPERIAYPDIDWDVSQRWRHIAIAYIAWRYGEDRVAQIITYGTLSVRTVISEVLKSAQISSSVIEMIKSTVPEEPTITLADMEEDQKFLKAMQSIPFQDTQVQVDRSNVQRILEMGLYKRGNTKLDVENTKLMMEVFNGVKPSNMITIETTWTWEKALHIMKRLEGLNKYESTHAAGVVVAPVELESNVPLLRKGGDGVLACQYDMVMLEALGYLKMDALGLRTVDVNHDAEALVRKWYNEDFDIRKVRYDDADTIRLINSGDTIGIFQIESSGFTKMMQDINIGGYEVERFTEQFEGKKLEIADFMWISAGIAMYRPGPLDAILDGKTMVQHLIDRKMGREQTIYFFREEKEYLEETYGILVYQEQVMSRVRQMTGCSLGRADILRKAMGKKDPILMKEQMDWFEDAAMNHDFSVDIKDDGHKKALISRAAEEIRTFARYGFNKAHTVEYAHICYRNAYLKSHYPTAFFAALLNSETGNPKRQTIIIRDMLAHGIQLLPPTVNESEVEFTMTQDNIIRFGLGAIKNIGGRAVDSIFADRKLHGPYKSVEHFRARVPSTDCTVTGMTNLAKCGAFDDLLLSQDEVIGCDFGNRATLVATMKGLCDAIGKIKRKKPKADAPPTYDEIMAKLPSVTFPLVHEEEDLIQYSIWEKEILKYYISAHPIDAYEDEIRRWTAIEDTEMEDLPDEFYIAGFVEGCHETIIKKEGRNKGKAMGFLTIGTAYRTYEATMFPGVYESCLPYIKLGEPVVVKGSRNVYKGEITIQAIYVRKMTNSGIRDCPECHVRIDSPTYQQLTEMQSLFQQHPGNTKVILHTIEGYNDMAIECGKTVTLNDHIIDYIESVAKLSYKPN